MTAGRLRVAAGLAVAAVAAGFVAAGLTELLHAVQHLAFGYRAGTFEAGAVLASPGRRVLALTVGGVVAGAGWYALQRWLPAPVRVRVAVRDRTPMRTVPTSLEALLQIVVVGLGASLGRESAPRRMSGAAGQVVAHRFGLGPEEVRLVVACAAGAGFGAVYDVPLAGTLFTAEVLLRTRRPGPVAVAAATCSVATVVAWIAVPHGSLYEAAVSPPSPALVLGTVLAVPVSAVTGWGFARATSWASARRPVGRRLPALTVPVFAGLGVVGVWAPSLLGNGRGPASLALGGDLAVPVLLVLGLAKPLVTAACLRAGATGGQITPAFATGTLVGAGLGGPWAGWWSAGSGAPYAVLVAAGVLAVTMRAPVTAAALAWELTGTPVWFLVPVAVTVAGAWWLARPRHGRASPRGAAETGGWSRAARGRYVSSRCR